MSGGSLTSLTLTAVPEPSTAALVVVGLLRSPWKSREACPKNMAQARERGRSAVVAIAEPYRPGLAGLEQRLR